MNKKIEDTLFGLLKNLSHVQNNENLSSDTKIEDLNLDSLDILELEMEIDKVFNVQIPTEKFSMCAHLHDLCNLIDEQLLCKFP